MQDRFKFRIFEYETKEMVELDAVGYSSFDPFAEGKSRLIMIPSGLGNTFHYDKQCLYDNDKFSEPMQCTGLKDKNGKLIYEGDIVKINTWMDKIVPDDFDYRYENEKGFALYQIFYNQEKTRFEAQCIKYTKEKPYRCFLLEYVPTNHKVIGNIYENPELLEVSNDY